MQLLYHHLFNRELVYLLIKTTSACKIDNSWAKESIYCCCLLNLGYQEDSRVKYLDGKELGI